MKKSRTCWPRLAESPAVRSLLVAAPGRSFPLLPSRAATRASSVILDPRIVRCCSSEDDAVIGMVADTQDPRSSSRRFWGNGARATTSSPDAMM